MHALDVHDLMTGIARAVDAACVLHRVERRSDPPVTGGVGEGLEASTLERGDELGEHVRRVEGVAGRVRAVRIRRQHGRRVRLDHVVDVELDRSHPEPVVVVRGLGLRESIQLLGRGPRRVEQRRDHPRAHRALVAGLPEERQVIERVLGLHRGRDPELRGHVEAPEQPSVHLVGGEVGDLGGQGGLPVAREPHHREVGHEPGGLAGARIPLRTAERERWPARADAEPPHRLVVQPHVVDVVGEDHERPTRRDALEILGRGSTTVRERRVAPVLRHDPLAVGMLGRVSIDRGTNPIQRGGVAELDGVGVGAGPQVVVRVDEAGQDRVAAGVELLGIGAHGIADLPIVADGRDPSVTDADRLGRRPPLIDGPHLGVADHQIHRA